MITLRTSHRWVSLAALTLATTLLSPIPWVTPPAAAAPDTTFTFEGGGWGHTVGLSQYGAYGMALLDGADYESIITHYYTGTSLGNLGTDVAAAQPLWVNLEREATAVTLAFHAIGASGATTVLSRDGGTIELQPGDSLTIEANGMTADGSPTCRLTTSYGHDRTGSCSMDLEWDGSSDEPTARFSVENVKRAHDTGPGARCTNLDWNTVPSLLRTCSYSRGELHVRPDADSVSFHLVAEMDVEDYVLGISEMPYWWAEPASGPNGLEALKAQIVTARSYAIHRQIDRGDPEDRPGCWCHVYDTSVDQRYVGWGHSGKGQQAWLDAARETEGVIVLHPDVTKNGKPIPVETFYGSSSYGRTEPSTTIFSENVPWLQSVDDHWAMEPVVRNPASRWSKSLTGSELARALRWTNRSVASVEVISCSPSGAADEVRFTDENGAAEIVRARTLWSLLGLRSPQITNAGSPPPAAPPCGGLGREVSGMAAVSLLVDDDASGDSVGDGDGVAECGETVELITAIENQLAGAQTGIVATVSTSDPHAGVVHNVVSTVADLGPGQRAGNSDDWDVAIAAGAPNGHIAVLAVSVTSDQGGPWVLEFQLPITCATPSPDPGTGGVVSTGITVDDGVRGDSIGNNDKAAQCGETVELYLAVTNTGTSALANVTATMSTSDPYLTLLHNAASGYPSLESASTAENFDDWDVAIAANTPAGHVAALRFEVKADNGSWTLDVPLAIGCSTSPPPGPNTGAYAVAGLTVDDGVLGDSIGNNDKTAQCGETIELYVALSGSATTATSATLTVPDTRLLLLYNTTAGYPALNGGTAENDNDWDIRIPEVVPDGLTTLLQIDLTAADGTSDQVFVPLVISCAGAEPAQPVAASAVTIDDGVRGDSVGNSDKTAQCGETIELYVALTNRGSATLEGVTAQLTTTDPNLKLLYNTSSGYGNLPAGESGENFDDWDILVSSATPNGHLASVRLTVSTTNGGGWSIPVEFAVRCP